MKIIKFIILIVIILLMLMPLSTWAQLSPTKGDYYKVDVTTPMFIFSDDNSSETYALKTGTIIKIRDVETNIFNWREQLKNLTMNYCTSWRNRISQVNILVLSFLLEGE